jgi:hypothetical protein
MYILISDHVKVLMSTFMGEWVVSLDKVHVGVMSKETSLPIRNFLSACTDYVPTYRYVTIHTTVF